MMGDWTNPHPWVSGGPHTPQGPNNSESLPAHSPYPVGVLILTLNLPRFMRFVLPTDLHPPHHPHPCLGFFLPLKLEIELYVSGSYSGIRPGERVSQDPLLELVGASAKEAQRGKDTCSGSPSSTA